MSDFPASLPPLPPLSVNPPPSDFRDPASHSFPGRHFTQHIHLDFHLDHTTQQIQATANYVFRNLDTSVQYLHLDIRGLEIHSISSHTAFTDHKVDHTIENPTSPIGPCLKISLPSSLRSHSTFNLTIKYTTSGNGGDHPAGGAFDWLSAQQTSSQLPFAFTQCQAIHARSIFPCQDTPAVKSTYSAVVSVAEPYQHLAVVMSAQRVPSKEEDRKNSARFECAVPVPSYLVALACGQLQFKELSERCCVWAEPSVLEKAAWEFEQVEQMLATAEEIAGPYVWGRYDLLVLPGSFPYGGMENPFLTFVTPTLLAGDRSLVSVVVHEISHSWSGNLVSCQDCRHFWVNEGFTVKLERRILREIYGPGREGLDAVAGRRTLDDFIESVGPDHKYTSLVTNLQSEEDPDDYFSCVAYEKGYNLLLWLEHCVDGKGGDFHEFLRKYFHANRYQSITSMDFVDMFTEQFPEVAKEIDFAKWLHSVGHCPSLAPVDRSLVDEASSLAQKWVEALKKMAPLDYDEAMKELRTTLGSSIAEFKSWDSKQKLCFLTEFKASIATSKQEGETTAWDEKSAKCFDTMYGLNEIRNSEIRFRWCRLALSASFEKILDNVKDFVSSQGRMKFIRPLYNDLHQVYPKGDYAKDLFAKNKSTYHSIASKMIERDLGMQKV